MDVRAKTVVVSLLALMGLLALTAGASLHYAEPHRALQGVLFGQTE
jgi:hypothetical protein